MDNREKGGFSAITYIARAAAISEKGESVTHRGEQRARRGEGLDALVNPLSHAGSREAVNLLIPQDDGKFLLRDGVAMPVLNLVDTTGSMGGNVEVAFKGLPDSIRMLVQSPRSVLSRYHVQIATGVVQDVGDLFPLEISEFEPDNEIENQMGLLVPEHNGHDETEDYQAALWYAAYRIRTSVVKYGIKGYCFVTGDEKGRGQMDSSLAKRIADVQLQSDIPSTKIGSEIAKTWHPFYLQVGAKSHATGWWQQILGEEHVIMLPSDILCLAAVQSAIIGLTEGTLDLQSVADFLVAETAESQICRLDKRAAAEIARRISHIPVGAQQKLPGFDRIPEKGSVFASRDDLWPVGLAAVTATKPPDDIAWQL